MTQAQPILDRFADAYLVAMLDSQNPGTVLASYEKTHPELTQSLREQASSLKTLYGFLETETFASEQEISVVYSRFALPVTPLKTVAENDNIFKRVVALFARPSFTYRFATVLTVVVATLFLWRPWSSTSPSTPALTPIISDTEHSTGTVPNHSNPTAPIEEAPTLRGNDIEHSTTGTSDNTHLHTLTTSGALTAPKMVSLLATGKGVVIAEWEPVKGAMNYAIEVKAANDAEFHPVTHSSRTKMRITDLPVGETVGIRVVATSGERKGPPSEVMTIGVQ